MPLPDARRNTIALIAVCLGALMFGLEITSVPAILPTLERLLHGDFTGLQWVMNAYTIACTTVLMATGTLADRFGRKLVFLVSIAAFGITSLACGLAADMTILIVGRFLQGMAGGALLICTVAILSHQFPDGAARSRAFAVWGVVSGIGLGFGPVIGGAILTWLGWQWVFLIHVPLALLAIGLARGAVTESRDPEAKRLDMAGIVTLSLAVFGFTWCITQGPARGLGDPAMLAILAAAAVCLVLFLFAETRQAHPMFDFSVFRIPAFSGAIFGCMGMNFSYWPLMIYLPIYFQIGLGYDSVTAGLSLLAYTLPTLVVPPVGERLALRYGPGRAIPFGLFTIGLGFLAMAIGTMGASTSWVTILPGALIAGIGIALTNTPVTNTTTAAVPASRAGMASGIDISARLITLAINIALMGVLLVEGIVAGLKRVMPAESDPAGLRALAEGIAAGNAGALEAGTGAVVQTALAQGFRLILLYGGLGVWLLAGLSFLAFRAGAAGRTSLSPCAVPASPQSGA